MPASYLHEHYETVVATLACRIEELQETVRWKNERIENLERLNADYRRRLGESEPAKRPSDMLFKATDILADIGEDPFEEADK